MGLDPEALLREAGAMEMKGTYCIVGTGEHKGEPILELPSGVWIVDRAQWLEVLLKCIPEERLHANKKLASVEEAEGEDGVYVLCFQDGSTYEADAVIGCDGTWSKIRQLVLGPDYEYQWLPRFGGYWDARGRTTPEKAAEYFGTELFDPTGPPNEVALVGNGGFLLFAPSDEGKVYYVIISAKAGSYYDTSASKVPLSREFLEARCKDWDEGFRKGVVESLLADDSGPGVVFSQWESKPVASYCRARMCVLGDAAHATTPWMGQGACQSIEDAAVMSSLLSGVQSANEV